MATLILSAIGTAFGGPLGGALGALIGRQVDNLVFRSPAREAPRLAELKLTTSSYGLAMPRHYGRMRVSGQVIWATDLVESRDQQGGGKSSPATTSYSYSASFAIALGSRPIGSIGRVWADGKLLRGAAGDMKVAGTMRFHSGEAQQSADPLLVLAEGSDRCPAYRGLAYVVFEDLQLSEFGNRIPTLSFEIFADTGTLDLSRLVAGVVEDCDADLPLTGLAGLSCEGPLAETLQALDPFYAIDADAAEEQLVLRPERLQSAVIALQESATSTRREDFGGNAGYARKRAEETQQPVRVLRYYDVDRDFQPGAQRASGRPLPGQPRAIELPAALTASDARMLVETAAQRSQWSRQTISWRVTSHNPAVRPGAKVSLPGHPGLWRVESWEWHDQGIDLSLVRLSPNGALTLFADPGRASQASDIVAAPTTLIAAELPWDGNATTPVPLILAAASSALAGWSGAALYVDQGDGALQPLATSGRFRARIGTASAVLPAANPLLFDRHSSAIVTLLADDFALVDATSWQLTMGANRALLGDEIIQFASAEPLGQRRWKLSGLWRGRGGTEWSVASHATGERFLLLDGGGTVLDPQVVGDTPQAVIAAIGIGDSAPVTAPIALRGIGWRPLRPVHGRVAHLSDGSAVLSWTRRARGGWTWNDAGEMPLNEQSEAYSVSYGSNSAGEIATWDLAVPNLALPAAAFAQLTQAVPGGRFLVRQRGDRSLSDALAISVT